MAGSTRPVVVLRTSPASGDHVKTLARWVRAMLPAALLVIAPRGAGPRRSRRLRPRRTRGPGRPGSPPARAAAWALTGRHATAAGAGRRDLTPWRRGRRPSW